MCLWKITIYYWLLDRTNSSTPSKGSLNAISCEDWEWDELSYWKLTTHSPSHSNYICLPDNTRSTPSHGTNLSYISDPTFVGNDYMLPGCRIVCRWCESFHFEVSKTLELSTTIRQNFTKSENKENKQTNKQTNKGKTKKSNWPSKSHSNSNMLLLWGKKKKDFEEICLNQGEDVEGTCKTCLLQNTDPKSPPK